MKDWDNNRKEDAEGHSLPAYLARHGASEATVRAAEYFTKLSFVQREQAYPDFLDFLMTELGQDTEHQDAAHKIGGEEGLSAVSICAFDRPGVDRPISRC